VLFGGRLFSKLHNKWAIKYCKGIVSSA
jgi:hypothetical protein